MVSSLIIADDLTGANATGVLMTKSGYKTFTITNDKNLDLASLSEFDSIVYPTDSRGLPAGEAYRRVFDAAVLLKTDFIRVYSKRIDTTLRGNLGQETMGLQDALGGGRVACVVPCFPSSGRVNIGGYLLVQGIPLHRTEAAADPKTPVNTPRCCELYNRQSKYPTESILMTDLMQGVEFVAAKIKAHAAHGVRNIIFDAVSEEDIEMIADAVVLSGVPFVAVDPGPFTAAVSRKLLPDVGKARDAARGKIFSAVGSVNAVAQRQVEFFLSSFGSEVLNVYIETAELLESPECRKKEILRVTEEILSKCEYYEVCSIVGIGIQSGRRVPFEPYAKKHNCSVEDLSNIINDSIAEITSNVVLSDKGFKGLYTCGGDITVAVCRRMKNAGLQLLDEVLPLASYGELSGGAGAGLKIITKGGMVGDTDAIVRCIRYLREKITGG
ncbi:MAG: four-carbon acid sugar kinase family protein [Termitinemataceae bacterium]|nr:MAG: four-carbon acid sugar kinase family protein [Termitinemataceae bacterium]